MANEQQLNLLKEGVEAWNQWRQINPEIRPDLNGADLHSCDIGAVNLVGAAMRSSDLSGANLMGADMRRADLAGANLSGAYLSNADFSEANLTEVNLSEAYLFEADLSRVNLNGADLHWVYLGKADLSGAYMIGANLNEVDLRGANLIGANLSEANLKAANLTGADLQGADLRWADLQGANLMGARLLKTSFEQANLEGCSIYGISCWGLNLEGANQSNLIITPPGEPTIAVDNLEVAQFIYLLLNHKQIREVINTVPSKIVLLIGRLTKPERKEVLEAIREKLRQRNYLPILFDLEKPGGRDRVETVSCLASMARFIIADLSDAKNIPQELQSIVHEVELVPLQVLLQAGAKDAAMLEPFKKYPLVLEPYRYENVEEAIAFLYEKVIAPVEAKANELIKSNN
ncbi:pentapeptide repeat-containing protein [Microcoleus sp. FACHB-831]|uniref:pentapeptide repeat-containing protein n=1 Tax=Microcoleus sp. FACHB-831 TaxID=2692827 RepID=UPI001686DA33|nr:pentapeptide repeat-containing protein [Microcoleus sp. FACHB-831]MBD1922966.1 pentapeptide repeat-containing protein [Microcoleus sp. FACHB-831]